MRRWLCTNYCPTTKTCGGSEQEQPGTPRDYPISHKNAGQALSKNPESVQWQVSSPPEVSLARCRSPTRLQSSLCGYTHSSGESPDSGRA